ncbi:MAG TPA: PDZ domain-containing protein [Gemmatimonadaceae bacterium]|nr:PDZ domain-containing protein [Gemmatimonadaceae bacterium]
MRSLQIAVLVACLSAAVPLGAQTTPPQLLRTPTISRTLVAFSYGGDIWTAPRTGGAARRLTAGGDATNPVFSPSGSLIAFSATYDGNTDVYVVSTDGGVPTRLTYHPAPDVVVGWTPDGSHILFRSPRSSFSRFMRLYTVSKDGGPATDVAVPRGYTGSFSTDGARLAYVPNDPANEIWKRYRGGMTSEIWLARMSDASIERVPRENSNDNDPMWVGSSVYFLSDRNGPTTLFEYDTKAKQVTQVVANTGLDIKSASAGPDAIVYEQFGALFVFDPATKTSTRIPVTVAGDLPAVRPHYVPVAQSIAAANLSPTGARAVFEAHGEIVTVPADKGDIRNITNTPAVMERDPAWSPDGRSIAYLSDTSGEYTLRIAPQNGVGAARAIPLGDAPSFYYSPRWSPDGKKISYLDKRLQLWCLDVATGKSVKVDTDPYEAPWRAFEPVWSPDSRWIAYTKSLPNHFRAVYLYSLESATATRVTDAMVDARFPTFDRGGEYLYFAASTNAGASAGWLDMSSYDRPVTRSLYLVVLRNDRPSPLVPLSDEEKGDTTKKKADTASKKADTTSRVRVDLPNIDQRVLALPIGERRWSGLAAGAPGTLFALETVDRPAPSAEEGGGSRQTLDKWDLTSRKLVKVTEGIMGLTPNGDVDEHTPTTFRLSANGQKMLYKADGQWTIAPVEGSGKPGEGVLNINDAQVAVDPRAEWAQMYHEAWRVERDFFYDPHFHGLDLAAAEAKYAVYVPGLASRDELRYLLTEALGELTVGHLFISGGGDMPAAHPPRTGLLGADYDVDHGRYRFARIYSGENWNPALKAPLTQPGVNVAVGEYLLAVNGVEVRATEDVSKYFGATAGKTVILRVGRDPTAAGARDVSVVPVGSEAGLRNLAWIEENRRTVDRLSGGKLAYVYLPNTAGAGYTSFNRYYFAQTAKQGVVLDERFNGGGSIADYMIEVMQRQPLFHEMTRDASDFVSPVGAIYGPKVMITNEYAGSGGDALPFMFHETKLGPLVGKRTWGGLVGIYDYPPLMDGMTVTAPRVALYTTRGQFEIENHGVAPDVTVDLDPSAWRAGHDTQLERAVSIALDALAKTPSTVVTRPSYPNYHQAGSAASGSSRAP